MKSLDVRVELPLDRFALDVEFEATRPVTGVFGPSGAGKSSLVEAIAGLRPRTKGRIRLGETVWLDSEQSLCLPPERRGVGYVPQEGLLFPHLDVTGNLQAGIRRAAESNTELLDTVVDLLGLTSLLHRDVTTLSGGERQRVAVGRALCSGPDVLLFDEPLAALDLPLRRRLLTLLRRLRSELTIPMVLISHDPIEIQALCDEVLVLRQGRVSASGSPAEVLSDPRVTPPGPGAGYSNVLPGTITEAQGHSAAVLLAAAGPVITVAPATLAPGDTALLELPADRILIAMEPPPGLSARNALPAIIRRIQPGGGIAMVHAELQPGGPNLVVEVTESTPERLGLAPDRAVHLVFKATSCRLHAERDPRTSERESA